MIALHKCLLVAGVGAGLLAAAESRPAHASIKTLANTKLAAPRGTAMPFATQIAELHQVATQLQNADHDYKGHRAKAVEEIHAAIKSLQPAGHHHAQHATAHKHNKEAQAASDAQLQQAVKELAAIETQLPPGSKAVASVQAAIGELNTALKIK
jgi:chromosome segregation ATPase